MISDPVRRTIVVVLAERGQTTRAELAEALAEAEDVPGTDADALEIHLHHNHLPRLDDEQYLEYDARSGDVVPWKEPEWVQQL